MSVGSGIDLYDTEILEIEKVLGVLNEKVGRSLDIEAFTKEVKERFAEIGLVVSVAWYEYAADGKKVEGSYLPEITVIRRTEKPGEFDHDRLKHEIVNDVLDLPGQTKGELIKPDAETVRRFMAEHGKHSHD